MARTEALRAIAIVPTDGLAHNLLGELLLRELEWDEAREVLDRGLAHNPGSGPLHFNSGVVFATREGMAEAVAEMRRAVDLDPRQWWAHAGLGLVHWLASDFDAAIPPLERAWDLAPVPVLRGWLSYAYFRTCKDQQALESSLRDLPPELGSFEAAVRRGFEEPGILGATRARLAWRVANGDVRRNEFGEIDGGLLAFLGETDAMFECLERQVARRDQLLLKPDPLYEPYYDDPRFAALLRRMNPAE